MNTTAVSTAVQDAASQVTGLITTNLPVLLGVTVAFLGLAVARKFIHSLGH